MCYYVVVGETLSLLNVLRWVSDMQFDNVDFALDSKITRDDFHHRQVKVTEFDQVTSVCRSLFNTHFSNFKVDFKRRLKDKIFHTLIGIVPLPVSPNIYYHVPRCIDTLIINKVL